MDVDGQDDKEGTIKQLQELCESLTQELCDCRKRRKDLLEESRTLKMTLRDLEARLPKLSVEIAGCDTTREELTRLLPTLQAQIRLGAEDEETLRDCSPRWRNANRKWQCARMRLPDWKRK
jgi:chromosome segregation ATPase